MKHQNLKIFTFILVAIFNFGLANSIESKVVNLKCDEKILQLGVNQSNLNFSWSYNSKIKNARQKYYRVVVSSSLQKLEVADYDIWDSRRTKSTNQVHVSYKGKKLEGGQKYFWKVMIWDDKNQSTDWSDVSWFLSSLGNDSEWKNAVWIGHEELQKNVRLVPGIHTQENHDSIFIEKDAIVPYFRKSFNLNKPVKEAFLFITGLGHYEAFANGKKISDSFLAPGWTYYDKNVLFNTYELTDILDQGENVLGAIVGNGFHYINHHRYLKFGIAFGYPKMICRLKISYTDGSEDNIVSDTSWKTSPSPITFSSIYGGEDYDARKEQAGWNIPKFDDTDWAVAQKVNAPNGQLESEIAYPLTVKDKFLPKNIYTINDSCFTYDFGQNASGIIAIKVKGKRGDKIRIWPGELLSAYRKVNQKASGSPYYYEYILKGGEEETWQPKFTYYGFRYAMIEGASPTGFKHNKESLPVVSFIELLHTRNSTPQVGSFECSSELMNSTYNLINWAIKSNMQSVMTDCPHREKLGWLEQSYLMGNSIRYNYSVYHLYRKKIKDMIHAQRNDGLIPDIAPEYVIFSDGFVDSPEWGSAAVILPWMVYKWYGDKSVLDEAYPMMERYVKYLESKSEKHILSHGLGDWFDYGPNPPGVAQLTPVALTATAIYYYDVKLLADIAKTLNRKKDVERFTNWANDIKKAFNTQFYDSINKTYSTGSQTSISMPLCVGLTDDENKEAVLASLCKSIEKDGFALTAGDIGFHFLVEALSEGEYSEILYKMINRKDVPGYGFQLAKGATSLTESWPALEEVSNNHLMLGHIMEWFYTSLLGINDAPDAIASDKIILRPNPVGDITWAKGEYLSPRGLITVDWKIENSKFHLKCSIPNGIEAKIIVPRKYKTINNVDFKHTSQKNVKTSKTIDNSIELNTKAGEFVFVFQ